MQFPATTSSQQWLRHWRLLGAVVCWGLLAGCASDPTDHKPQLTIYAAASLKDCLQAIVADFDPDGLYHVIYNFAGSGVLAQQLMASQRADLFISAHQDWMYALRQQRPPNSMVVRPIVGNQLCLIANRSANLSPIAPAELASVKFQHLAIGDPNYVPLGRYAQHWLQAYRLDDGTRLWEQVAERILPTVDAQAALTTVANHSQILGIVYFSDFWQARDQVQLLAQIPQSIEQPIHYLAASLNQRALSLEFLDFLDSPSAASQWSAHGFQALIAQRTSP